MLSSQFDALNTRDRNDVIAEFRRLVGPHAATVNQAGCAFWLEMFNWNIHSAVGAFFDWQAPSAQPENNFNMTLAQDFTYADGENISPNTSFQKRWRLRNSGSSAWLPGTALRFIGGGSSMGDRDRFMVEPLQPGQVSDLMVTLVSPSAPGQYQGQWRLATPTGSFFGDIIWIVIQVEEGGIMGVTQAMRHLASADGLTSDAVDSHHSTPSGGWNRTSASTATVTTTNAFLSKHSVEQMSQDDFDDAIATNNPFAMSSTLSLSSATSLPVGKSVGFESSFPSACHVSSLSPSSDFLNSEPSPPRPGSPQRLSPFNHRLSQSPVFAAFSPPSTSPVSSPSVVENIRADNGLDASSGRGSSLLAPPLILPPSPPPYASPTPSVGGFLVPPKLYSDAEFPPQSPTTSMSDDES